jgi:signal-transduction protein with cAMP-binding, CBS, and nucleotidyltransferase domain
MAMVELKPVLERLSGFPMLAFEAGDVVLSEGSTTGRLLFLIHGVVDVVKDDWVIARVSEMGAVFGDMAVLQRRPHSANVLAVQPSSFYLVEDAHAFLRREPLVALYVAVVQSSRIDAANLALIEARKQMAEFGQRRGRFVEVLDRIGSALHAPA